MKLENRMHRSETGTTRSLSGQDHTRRISHMQLNKGLLVNVDFAVSLENPERFRSLVYKLAKFCDSKKTSIM